MKNYKDGVVSSGIMFIQFYENLSIGSNVIRWYRHVDMMIPYACIP
jgi:hypothetical protein